MQRKPFTVRLSDDELAALTSAAAEDDRPAAMLARKLLLEGLARMGHRPERETPLPAPREPKPRRARTGSAGR